MINKTSSQNILDYKITDLKSVARIFPKNIEKINSLKEKQKTDLINNIEKFENVDNSNSFEFYDQMLKPVFETISILNLLEMVSPEEDIRESAQAAYVELIQFITKHVQYNPKIYQKLKSAIVTKDHKYSLDCEIKDFEKNGINLPEDIRKRVLFLQNELAQISSAFDYEIAQDTPVIEVKDQDLPTSIKELIKDNKISLTPPNIRTIMAECPVESIRESAWKAYNNRAFDNGMRMQELIKKRDELAKLLDFTSYSEYDLSDQMVKSPEKAQKFLKDLINKLKIKAKQEFDNFETKDKKIKPWNLRYLQEEARKKHLNINDDLISEYFEMQPTLAGLLKIYQDFFNIKFKAIKTKDMFWDKDVIALEVFENDKSIGYILLDIYPRENKYSHACNTTLIPAYKDEPVVTAVIANFPRPTKEKPSLLKFKDVVTFFHEFGHAIHSILGRTNLALKSGTNVKTDFVEMPSQMLEEWLQEPTVIQNLSKHYLSRKQLDDELVKNLTEVEKFEAGFHTLQQIYYALISLTLFEKSEIKNIQEHNKELYEMLMDNLEYVPNSFVNSFGHLTGYGSKYYGYLWSKVFALDLFSKIKENNLSPEIGKKYQELILQPGGTKDPEDMIKEFLGREPNNKAFFESLGIN